MDGVINVLKPAGMTSFDVVAHIRRMTRIMKIGHGGTLDPAATGVLPICIGMATKLSDYINSIKKSYRAEILFGVSTDSIDLDGAVVRAVRITTPERRKLESVIAGFVGEQLQTPPVYSALKVGGKRMCDLAREGVMIDREPRTITIYGISLEWVMNGRAVISVECSKGTYIRSICNDIGRMLGIDACMSFLIRTSAAGLRIENAYTLELLEDLNAAGELSKALIPVEDMLTCYERCALNNTQMRRFLNGADVFTDEVEPSQPVRVDEGDMLACYERCSLNNTQMRRFLNGADEISDEVEPSQPVRVDEGVRISDNKGDRNGENLVRVYDVDGAFYALGKILFNEGREVLRMKRLFRKGGD